MEIKTILVVVMPDLVNEEVLQRSEKLALRYEAAIELVMICSPVSMHSMLLSDDATLNHHEILLKPYHKQLKRYLTRLRNQGIDTQGEILCESRVYQAILGQAEKKAAQLLIKQTHKHSALANAFITNTDWHLIRESKIPLLLVKDREWGSHLSVAAAVDPVHDIEANHHLDAQLIETAHDLACNLPAELHIIHACEPIPTGLFMEFDDLFGEYDAYRERVKDHHQKALDKLLAGKVEANTLVHFEEGNVEFLLPSITEKEGIDVLVMGVVSRSALDRIMIGSTAERVLDPLKCDIWIMK